MTKPIQIRNDEVVRGLRDLAALQGKPLTATVADLVRRELARERRDGPGEDRTKVLDETVARFQAAMKAHGGRLLTDDDLYDHNGLPR